MKLSELVSSLETLAPVSLAEEYDNVGLLCGDLQGDIRGVLVALDATDAVLDEAIEKGVNVVVSFHPIIFKPFKKFTGKTYPERVLIKAIKHDIAIYAIHTALDNVSHGVNKVICEKLDLEDTQILMPKKGLLKKLQTYIPVSHLEQVRESLFEAGAGSIGKYHSCSFSVSGEGAFVPGSEASPFTGEKGKMSKEKEQLLSVIYPSYTESQVLQALKFSHPYEEVAYDIISVDNVHQGIGGGMVGQFSQELSEKLLLERLQKNFGTKVIRHSNLLGKPVKKVAVLGGSGSFAIEMAIASGADVFVSSDFKYHDFFRAESKIVLVDIGHYESEQYTVDLIENYLKDTLASIEVFKTQVNTNPVFYFDFK